MIRLKLNPLTESATWLRRAVVVVGSVGLTALYSLLVLLRALFGRLDRRIVDQYCREWSAALLKLVRANLTVRGAVPDFNDGRRYIIMCIALDDRDTLANLVPASFAKSRLIVKKMAVCCTSKSSPGFLGGGSFQVLKLWSVPWYQHGLSKASDNSDEITALSFVS